MIADGKVQGVGFRFFVQQQAVLLEIVGTVQNLDNGTVEINAEGELMQLEKFTTAVMKGIMFAKVADLRVFKHDDLKYFKGFKILY
jgi:acylphosphatase